MFESMHMKPPWRNGQNVLIHAHEAPWRNGLACWTSNSKVVGSSHTGGGILSF